MVSKTGKIAIVVVVIVVIVVAVVMVQGLVLNQPHFGFASKNQINSDTGQSFKSTSTSKTSVSNKSLFNFTGVTNAKFMTYSNGANVSSVSIGEFQFSSASNATRVYSTLLATFDVLAFYAKVAVNSTYSSFQYSEFSVLGETVTFAHSGTFLVLLTSSGIVQSGANAAFHSTISGMTSFKI